MSETVLFDGAIGFGRVGLQNRLFVYSLIIHSGAPPSVMQIVCPNCAARYLTPDASIGPDGRRVRCARCAQVWRAEPPPPSDMPPDDDALSPPAPDRAIRVDPLPRNRTPTTAEDNQRRRPPVLGWLIFVLIVAAVAAAFIFGRAQIQQVWPASIKLYEAVGFPNDAAPGEKQQPIPKLEVSGLQNAWIDGDKGLQLVLKGNVTNTGKTAARPPFVRIRLFDKAGEIVRDKRAALTGGDLAPGETRGFAISFQDPGEVARALPALEPVR